MEQHRRRTTDSRRDVFYARRGQTTTRRRRRNADAATSSPPTPSSHILLRPENVGRPRSSCTCRCAGESRRVRSGTIADDRRATKRIFFFFFFERHALLLISRRGDAELGTRYFIGRPRVVVSVSRHGRQICVRQSRFCVIATVFQNQRIFHPPVTTW